MVCWTEPAKRSPLFIDVGSNQSQIFIDTLNIALGFGQFQTGREPFFTNFRNIGARMGHRFQVTWRTVDFLTKPLKGKVKFVELHADYLAGAYMQWRGLERKTGAVELAEMFFGLGDTATLHHDHHGTEVERYLTFQQGYHDFAKLKAESSTSDVIDAASMGLVYVAGTFH